MRQAATVTLFAENKKDLSMSYIVFSKITASLHFGKNG